MNTHSNQFSVFLEEQTISSNLVELIETSDLKEHLDGLKSNEFLWEEDLDLILEDIQEIWSSEGIIISEQDQQDIDDMSDIS